MAEADSVRQTANVIIGIIRGIDKRLEWNPIDPMYEGKVSFRLIIRGRIGFVSVRTEDLRMAVFDDASKNAVRRKIKSVRDHLLSNYVVDVMGKRIARLLKQSAGGREETKSSFFYRRPQGRR